MIETMTFYKANIKRNQAPKKKSVDVPKPYFKPYPLNKEVGLRDRVKLSQRNLQRNQNKLDLDPVLKGKLY